MTNISKTLQELVENGTERNPLPYKKGNSILIYTYLFLYNYVLFY